MCVLISIVFFQTFSDISRTTFEQEKVKLLRSGPSVERPIEAQQLANMVEDFLTEDHHDK